jgi:hypothetical protein
VKPPAIDIHNGPITFDEACQRLNAGSLLGYNAVWPSPTDRPEHQWKALHVSNDGGSSEWWAESRESAVACIHEALDRAYNFWLKKVRWHENGDRDDDGRQVIRIGGRHFVIGEEPTERALRSGACGFGGRLFTFRLVADGTVIRSRNVWTQGEIPDEFLDALPDNAKGVED